jgi:ribose transport system ATP-binding protein
MQPDEGQVLLEGKPLAIASVREAQMLGIALIHQELNLADNLDVATNIFLGREPHRFGLTNSQAIHAETVSVLTRIGLACPPGTIVSDLAAGHQQMVEIAKAVAAKARILIMDEPTSSLSQHETKNLYRVIRELREAGVSIIYISHRLGEVKELADRVVVLRDGQNAGELAKTEIHHEAMVGLMVGRDLSQFYQRKEIALGGVTLHVEHLRTPAHPGCEIGLQVRSGEIVGMAGLVGAGRTELLRVLFGIDKRIGGHIRVSGREMSIASPLDAIRAGLALVPEDRKEQGLILEMAVRENLSLASLRRDQRRGFLNQYMEDQTASRMIKELVIKTPSSEQIVQFLSGGNQQKVVLGKWLALEPRVLLLDEPTRGIDVGSKQEIYRLMESLAERGVGILFVSSEMEEVLGMSDRVLVMHQGRIAGEVPRTKLSEEAVMRLATGGER